MKTNTANTNNTASPLVYNNTGSGEVRWCISERVVGDL